jgi:hypothetical protein
VVWKNPKRSGINRRSTWESFEEDGEEKLKIKNLKTKARSSARLAKWSA